jgi:hypothetical protein
VNGAKTLNAATLEVELLQSNKMVRLSTLDDTSRWVSVAQFAMIGGLREKRGKLWLPSEESNMIMIRMVVSIARAISSVTNSASIHFFWRRCERGPKSQAQ